MTRRPGRSRTRSHRAGGTTYPCRSTSGTRSAAAAPRRALANERPRTWRLLYSTRSMSAPPEVPRGARPRRAATGYKMWIYGEKRAVLRDAYHTFLHLPWPASLGLIMVALFVANVVFASLYFGIGGVEGAASGSFFDDLSFSVQTMATIGYGVMNPKSNGAQTVMIVESLFGIIFTALATGLVFAKFSRATARIRFSKDAVITPHDGKPTLMFRVGNERSNVIVHAQLKVIAACAIITAE